MNGITAVSGATQRTVLLKSGRQAVEKDDQECGGKDFFYVDNGRRVSSRDSDEIYDALETDPVKRERNERVARYPRTNTNDTGE